MFLLVPVGYKALRRPLVEESVVQPDFDTG